MIKSRCPLHLLRQIQVPNISIETMTGLRSSHTRMLSECIHYFQDLINHAFSFLIPSQSLPYRIRVPNFPIIVEQSIGNIVLHSFGLCLIYHRILFGPF